MQSIQTILRRLTEAPDKEALYWNDRFFSYAELNTAIAAWEPVLKDNGVGRGTVCAFLGDYSPQTAALIFALMKVKAVMVPFTYAIQHEIEEFKNIAGVECMFRFAPDDTWTFERYNAVPRNALIENFMQRDVPGLIVFS
ncbi:MAG TPA: AMP-binding protein, partial [bacterium]|nr:AMP-binding protein [bacterium]